MSAKRFLLEASGMGDTEDEAAGNNVSGFLRRRGTTKGNNEVRIDVVSSLPLSSRPWSMIFFVSNVNR